MKTESQIQMRIDTLTDVITFSRLIKLDSVAIANLKSFIKILEWVLADEEQ